MASKDGKLNTDIICNDELAPSFVYVVINGTPYELKIVTLTEGGTMQTEVLKLIPGSYTIEEFAVYNGTPNNNDDADDTVLFASPEHSSDYVTNWAMTGVGQGSTPFVIEAFKKAPVHVDVLCYVPSAYVDFGFTWFQFDKFKAKKIYFFGDVCTKFWEEWKDYEDESNPYLGAINGYDFPAAFTVDVYKGLSATGVPAVSGTYTPSDYVGIDAEPLCIEYVDNLQSVDESYTFVISLTLPDGTSEVIHTGNFTDANWSKVTPDEDTFGGLDGIFDFVVGNCSYDGNNANEELPAWIPVAKTGTFKLGGPLYGSHGGYTSIEFGALDLEHADTFMNGTIYGAFCAAKVDQISLGVTYPANFYSSLGGLTELDDTKYANLKANIGVLNWIVNNQSGWTAREIQAAIWHFTDGQSATTLSTTASTYVNFVPTVGDWAIIVCDAIEADTKNGDYQLMVVRVDP